MKIDSYHLVQKGETYRNDILDFASIVGAWNTLIMKFFIPLSSVIQK